MKKSLNDDFTSGSKLVQKCFARLWRTHHFVHRFLTFVPLLKAVSGLRSDDPVLAIQTKEVFAAIPHSVENEKVVFLELNVISDVFVPLLHAQALLKTAKKINFPPVMPVPESLKCHLTFLSKSVSFVAPNFEQIVVLQDFIVILAQRTFRTMRNIPCFNI